jgi:hypothetical protein
VAWRLPHRILPPPEQYTVELLAEAVRKAVAHIQAPYPEQLLDGTVDDESCGVQASALGGDCNSL